MKTQEKRMLANTSTRKALKNKGLADISRPLKRGKGYYMKIMPKNKASKIMQARANDRWSKATPADRHAIGLKLAQARKAKRVALSII